MNEITTSWPLLYLIVISFVYCILLLKGGMKLKIVNKIKKKLLLLRIVKKNIIILNIFMYQLVRIKKQELLK